MRIRRDKYEVVRSRGTLNEIKKKEEETPFILVRL